MHQLELENIRKHSNLCKICAVRLFTAALLSTLKKIKGQIRREFYFQFVI